ncbi:flagellar basal body P-ring protein FlgI [Desulfobacterota bacterium M19]
MKKILLILTIFLLDITVLTAQGARLKDMAQVGGVRDNQLLGYGLVVGLHGTGDGNKSTFTTQGLANMLKNVGMNINANDIKVKNVAGVLVTTSLPPFAKNGQEIDVTISSLGDASSLQGGTLIATPLRGLDGKIYAMAQGPVSIGGFVVPGGRNRGQKNHLTVARIPNGATVEREVPVSFAGRNYVTISLNRPDFTTVIRVVKAINNDLGGDFAKARDGASVRVEVPESYKNRQVALLAELEDLDVRPDNRAMVVVDERTGTVVMGENVRISRLALAHGSLSVQVSAAKTSPIASAMVGKLLTNKMVKKMTAQIASATAGRTSKKLAEINPGVTLGQLVRALNSVGVAPRDLIAILQAIKAAGAMQAELKII